MELAAARYCKAWNTNQPKVRLDEFGKYRLTKYKNGPDGASKTKPKHPELNSNTQERIILHFPTLEHLLLVTVWEMARGTLVTVVPKFNAAQKSLNYCQYQWHKHWCVRGKAAQKHQRKTDTNSPQFKAIKSPFNYFLAWCCPEGKNQDESRIYDCFSTKHWCAAASVDSAKYTALSLQT